MLIFKESNDRKKYANLQGKEKEFFNFLAESLDWDNMLTNNQTDEETRKQINYTVTCLLEQKNYDKMLDYFWRAIASREDVNDSLKAKGFKSFKSVSEIVAKRFPFSNSK